MEELGAAPSFEDSAGALLRVGEQARPAARHPVLHHVLGDVLPQVVRRAHQRRQVREGAIVVEPRAQRRPAVSLEADRARDVEGGGRARLAEGVEERVEDEALPPTEGYTRRQRAAQELRAELR